MEKIKRIIEKSSHVCSQLNRSQKFYFFGLISLLNLLFWYLLPFKEAYKGALLLPILLIYGGILSDILILYKKVWGTVIGKGMLLLLFSFCLSFAYAFSAQLINETVKFDTSKVTYSINLTAVLLVPFIVIAITYFIFAILFLFGQFYLILASFANNLKDNKCLGGLIPNNMENYPYKTFWVRVILYPIAFGFLWGMAASLSPAYAKGIANMTSHFIYFFDAKTYSRCKQSKGDRVVTINDKEIIMVKKLNGKIYFEPKACTPVIKQPIKKVKK